MYQIVLHSKDMIDQDYGTNGLNYLKTKHEIRMERRREQNQREQRLLRGNERGFRGVGSVVQLEDPADATDCLDDFIKLIEEICNVYPEQGRGLQIELETIPPATPIVAMEA